jgi:hypothetical protein
MQSIADKLKAWMPESRLGRAAYLAIIQTISWFYVREIIQMLWAVMAMPSWMMFAPARWDLDANGNMFVMPISLLISSLVVAWFVCVLLFRRMYMKPSYMAFNITGLLVLFITFYYGNEAIALYLKMDPSLGGRDLHQLASMPSIIPKSINPTPELPFVMGVLICGLIFLVYLVLPLHARSVNNNE